MTKVPICVNPIQFNKETDDSAFNWFVDEARIPYANQLLPYQLDVEITSKCGAGCGYCYASSSTEGDIFMPTERIKRLIEEARDMGIKLISWYGGDPQLHPDWAEIMTYAGEVGLENFFITSGMLSKRDVKKLCELESITNLVGIHIDTPNPDVYAQVHTNPKTLEARIRGWQMLMEAGYPKNKILSCLTLTKPVAERIEETVDWMIDEMGSSNVVYVLFKDEGLGGAKRGWEPSLTDVRKALEYRAKRLGQHWLRIGTSDGTKVLCRTLICVNYNGQVCPCLQVRNSGVGSIYEKSLKEIFEEHKDFILYNFDVKGPCSTCKNNDVCWGCRAVAYHYTGDFQASDPKCFMNTEAKEYYCK